MDHLNVVKTNHFSDESVLLSKNNKNKRVAYIVLELVNNGDLFDYIANSGAFPTSICKHYFK